MTPSTPNFGSSPPVYPPLNPPPPKVPDHELVRVIGRGAYGEVWLGRNLMGTWRAIKVVRRTDFDSDRPLQREFKGIRAYEPISRTHEGLVDILQLGANEADGCFYYVMELADAVESPKSEVRSPKEVRSPNAEPPPAPPPLAASEARGSQADSLTHQPAETLEANLPSTSPDVPPPDPGLRTSNFGLPSNFELRPSDFDPNGYHPHTLSAELKRRGRLPFADCLRIALSLADALRHLHAHGLVHRDIKPSNIIFVNGIPKLADIGLVAETGEARSIAGTEGFIAPEGPGSAQADLYSLGKTLYELSTGLDRLRFPEPRTDLGEDPEREDWLELNAIILKACEPASRRYRTAEELHADLVLLQGGKSVRRLRATERRLKMTARSLAIAIPVMLLTAAGWFWQQNQARRFRELAASERTAHQRIAEEKKRADHLLDLLDLEKAESLAARNHTNQALAHYARVLRRSPGQMNAITSVHELLALHRGPIRGGGFHVGVRFGSDGRTVLFPSQDSARALDTATGFRVGRVVTDTNIFSTETYFSPDGRWVVMHWGGENPGGYRVWDIENDKAVGPVLLGRPDTWSPDGLQVATRHPNGIRVWNVQSGKQIGQTLRDDDPQAFSPDGRKLVSTSRDESAHNVAQIWEIESGRPVGQPLQHNARVWDASFSPDGQMVLTASGDGTAGIWDANTGLPLWQPTRLGEWSIVSATFSPDGRWVVVRTNDEHTHVWESLTGRFLSSFLNGETGEFQAVSQDGRWLAQAVNGSQLRIRDMTTGRAVGRSLWHEANVSCVAFSPDGRRLVSSSASSVRVWDTQTGEPLSPWIRHDEPVNSVTFSPDGRWLLSLRVLDYPSRGAITHWWTWEASPVQAPNTPWLADFIETVGGLTVGMDGNYSTVPPEVVERFRVLLARDQGKDDFTAWARWLFADRQHRTVHWRSKVSLPEFVNRALSENATDLLAQAVDLGTTNGLVHARLAAAILAMSPEQRVSPMRDPQGLIERAVKLAPDSPEVMRIRDQVSAEMKRADASKPPAVE